MDADLLRSRRERPPGLAVAGAARLSEHVHEAGDDLCPGGRDSHGIAETPAPRDHAIHRWHRTCRGWEIISVLFYHDRVRCHFRISHPDCQRHDAEDHDARESRAVDW